VSRVGGTQDFGTLGLLVGSQPVREVRPVLEGLELGLGERGCQVDVKYVQIAGRWAFQHTALDNCTRFRILRLYRRVCTVTTDKSSPSDTLGGSQKRCVCYNLIDTSACWACARSSGLLAPGTLRQLAEDRRRGVREHGDHPWLLVCLEVWPRIFIDREDPASVMRAV
jgi:hypothetical protein